MTQPLTPPSVPAPAAAPAALDQQVQAARAALKQYYGYDSFRPQQEAIIRSVLGGHDTLVLMPTGGGKSVCFQVPALVLPGLCVVVSPLIALMQDQVEALRANGIAAEAMNSAHSSSAQDGIALLARTGRLKLLYVSPEKLLSPGFLDFLGRLNVSLFAIDEAHCISSWGHDFRPEYTQLNVLKERFAAVPVIALTATADGVTRRDIIRQLGLQQPQVFVASFDRPNISLTVQPGTDRVKRVLDFLRERPDEPGIVYCLSRKQTEALAEKLAAQGYRAAAYHAGLGPQVRAHVQRQFLQDDLQIICATIAFGMGIDKGNVRWVVHYNLPKNIEGYYQEIGRGGRDGAPAAALLLYSYADVISLEGMLSEAPPATAQLNRAKLERMRQYAEAAHCRRKILLHYFGETREHDCGNCDVCRNPPTLFDGTELAQKALSGAARLRERVSLPVLIDVLRGLRNANVLAVGGEQIKTWGAGRDLSYLDWYSYLHQLLNAGLLHIAYDEGYALRIDEAGRQVLRGERRVELARFQPAEKADRTRRERGVRAAKTAAPADAPAVLFELLKRVRKQLADAAGVPPYVVFSDVTLHELAATQPTTRMAMLAVSGVGPVKFEKWGEPFINAILDYVRDGGHAVVPDAEGLADLGYLPPNATVPAPPKRPRLNKEESKRATWELHQQGKTLDEVMNARELARSTVLGQLGELYAEGYAVRMAELLPRETYRRIKDVLDRHGVEYPAADITMALGGPDEVAGEHIYLSKHVYRRVLKQQAGE